MSERVFTQRDMETVVVDRDTGKLVEAGDAWGPVLFLPRWLYEASREIEEEL